MTEQNKDLVRRAWAAYDAGDEEGFRACLTDDWIERDGAGDSATVEDVIESMRLHRVAFPDKRTAVDEIIAEGDLVVTRSTTTATQTGSYLDLEPTGRTVRLHEMSMHRIRDGLIAETWQETGPGFYAQLTGGPSPEVGDNMT